MGKGLPKWAIKEAKRRGARNIFAYAWTLVKRKGKRRKSKKTRTSNPKRRKKVRRMGRRKRRRGGKSMTRTVFKLVRLGALVAPAASVAVGPEDNRWKLNKALEMYTGFWPGRAWKPEKMLQGWGPYIGACLATYGIPKLVSIIRRL